MTTIERARFPGASREHIRAGATIDDQLQESSAQVLWMIGFRRACPNA
ncbi:MAG: hypothetical protein GY715_03540 [Planctomycetes bacterium]|nr:hypothetical protein [Planctomycetota bacterium]